MPVKTVHGWQLTVYYRPIAHLTRTVLVHIFFFSLLSSKIVFPQQLSGNRNMFSLYPYYLRNRRGGEWYSRFQVTEMIEGMFGFDILASETFWGRKIWQAFFLGGSM